VPVRVALDEAIEIAKRFGGEDSGRFVNGILDRVARDAPAKGTAPGGGPPEASDAASGVAPDAEPTDPNAAGLKVAGAGGR